MESLSTTRMARKPYADLEIRILKLEEQGYPVEITFSGMQVFTGGYLRPGILPWVSSGAPTDDGQRLFEGLLAAAPLREAWFDARGQNPRRRIRLRIDDHESAAQLHTLPWELLAEARPGGTPTTLAADTATPFSRYLAGCWRPGSPVLARPIRLLVAIANPGDLAGYGLSPLDVDAEKKLIRDAVSGLEAGQLEVTFLKSPTTLEALEGELRDGYHILHFVGHGRSTPEGAHLFLADGEGWTAPVSEEEFAAMLDRQGESLRLVFLASCQTAACSPADAFRGFAPRLIAAGIPAVVAMQDQVPEVTVRHFTSTFYERLLRHGYVDLACNEARSALMTGRLPGASIPVLYMRLRSGQLFGRRGRILGQSAESFWQTLLGNIADGYCTPFLGPGVSEGLLPVPDEIAQALAEQYNYPFADRDDLPRVAQFIGTLDERRLRRDVIHLLVSGFERRLERTPGTEAPGRTVSDLAQAADWQRQGREMSENEVHHQLADLGLRLYVTTNFDNLMTLALKGQGLHPRREALAWRRSHRSENPGLAPERLVLPTVTEPVVLHLFGTDAHPRSMVLTEDDYLDFLACLARDYDYLIPPGLEAILAEATLLFLGYRLRDLDLKVILRGLLTHLDLDRYNQQHVAVQIEAEEIDEAKHQEVIHYFQRYFINSKIHVYWGSTRQFVTELHARWQEYGRART